MAYFLKGAGGSPLKARVEIEDGRITLHSRSGKQRNGGGERNPDYVPAFDAIFDRINVPDVVIDQVLMDSGPSRRFAESERVLATQADFEAGVLAEVKRQIRKEMRNFGRDPNAPPHQGNQNKKIRIDVSLSDQAIKRRLRVVPEKELSSRNDGTAPHSGAATSDLADRLPAAELRKVRPEHVHAALERLGRDDNGSSSSFDSSRDYDAVTAGGQSYAPKKLFGLALEEALQIEARPGHFSAGWGTPCFDILEEAGLWIVPKRKGIERPARPEAEIRQAIVGIMPTDEEQTWIEGNPRIAVHLKRERRPGLARDKREAFRQQHGALFCEKCGLDPVKAYGEEAGEACIEVHHHRTHVSDMDEGHETKLEDLKCLCSNCHRVYHRALTVGVPFEL